MRLTTKCSLFTTLVTCMLVSCSDDGGTRGGDSTCISAANAKVCGAVEEGRLTMTAEGLKPGSTLRINVEGQGPAEWTVSETGSLISAPGALGFLTYDGSIGTVLIEATAEDGTSLAGEVVLD
jgi:hypothetical protein